MSADIEITLMTPTGGRPEAFAQCERYISSQTTKAKIQWIVIDDCNPPTECTMGQVYHRGTKVWEQGINTQRYNMDQAISHIRGEYIFIIEDDDYYSPYYLETMMRLLKIAPIVGEGVAKYYNLKVPGHKTLYNYGNSSLCQTAFTKKYIPLFYKSVHSGEKLFDIDFWNRVKTEKLPALLAWNLNLSIGIKGMPGRSGITGQGHEDKGYYYDSNFSKLKELVGAKEAQFYINIINKYYKGVSDAVNR